MSASVYIFDLQRHPMPPPATLQDFGTLMEALGGRIDGPNLRFMQLAMRLERRFAAAGPGVWINRPVEEARSLRHAAWHFELPPADGMAVHQAMVEIAGDLNLVVYNDQAGIGFLPGGECVPAGAMPEPGAEVAAEATGGAEFGDPSVACRVLQPVLADILGPAGFVLQPSDQLGGLDQVMNDPGMEQVRTAHKTSRGPTRPSGADGSLALPEVFRHEPARLVVARLAGNPQFPRLLDAFDGWHARAELPSHVREPFEQLRLAIVAAQSVLEEAPAARRPIPASLHPAATDPREASLHHLEVTRKLEREAEEAPEAFWKHFGGPDGLPILLGLWAASALTFPRELRVDEECLACEVVALPRPGGKPALQVLLLEFPRSRRLDECQAIALVRGDADTERYLLYNGSTLEGLSADPELARYHAHYRSGLRVKETVDRKWLLDHIARVYGTP